MILVISLIINLVVVGLFLNVIATQNKDFMEFINSSDFEVIFENNVNQNENNTLYNEINQSN